MTTRQRPLLKAFLPIFLIFVCISAFSVVFSGRLNTWNINNDLLIWGNLVLFLVTTFSFILYRKALLAANTQAFLRNVYSGMLLKLFVCMVAAFIYISAAGRAVNTNGLFILMFLYLLYTFLEVTIILKLSRQIKHQQNA
jgi:hypothetical protein